MKRFKNYLLVALGLTAPVAALTLGGSLRGHTAGNPTPINVNVASPVPLPVSVNNSPSVSVANLP